MIVEFTCEVCGVCARRSRSPANTPKPPRFCSQACNGIARRGGEGPRPNVEFTCEACGACVRAYRSPSALEREAPRFCSIACLGAGQRGATNPSFSGGRQVLGTGYVVVLAPDHPMADGRGYILEHRLIAERLAERYLLPGEVVHHIDGDKQNNDPENLQLFSSQSEHMKHHAAEKRREA